MVFRGVACTAPFSPQLFEWLGDVILQACGERWNVRVRYFHPIASLFCINNVHSLNMQAKSSN